MKIFISYSRKDAEIAEELALALKQRHHTVFFDRVSLPPGEEYARKIRASIGQSDLLIFLLSENSSRKGSYALTELSFAAERWKSPDGKVLPVLLSQVESEQVPIYLRSVTFLVPRGNTVAEAVSAVERLDSRFQPIKKVTLLLAAAMSTLALIHYLYRDYKQLKTVVSASTSLNAQHADNSKDIEYTVYGQILDGAWQIQFTPETGLDIREYLVDVHDGTGFKGLGTLRGQVQQDTGAPYPRTWFRMPLTKDAIRFEVKAIEVSGKEHTPRKLSLDPVPHLMGLCKDWRDDNRHVPILHFNDTSVDYSVTLQLTGCEWAIMDARYSVDGSGLEGRIKLRSPWPKVRNLATNNKYESFTIPRNSKSVFLELKYIDGSTEGPMELKVSTKGE